MTISFGNVEVVIDPDCLTSGKLRYDCPCATPFTIENFVAAGAEITDGRRRTTWTRNSNSTGGGSRNKGS